VLGLHDVGENPDLVFIVLITGPILGASLGFIVGKYELRRFIPFHDNEKEKKVQRYFREFGGLLLLISPWIPVVGDLAPIVAGLLWRVAWRSC
jgi:membrane protein YqaA with SNARE-associated domain